MEDLAFILSHSIKQASVALNGNDYLSAERFVLRAAECALMLAKNSVGKQKEKYFDDYQQLKKMLADIREKQASPQPNGEQQTPDFVEDKEPSDDSATLKPQQKVDRAGDSLNPYCLNDYIGQPQAVTAVKDLINAAKLKNSAMPHIILYGSHGLGKTTFARIIAHELNVNLVEVNVTKIDQTELISILKRLKPRDIIFIDEIHTLPTIVAESVLYSALQDGKVNYKEGKGKFAKMQEIVLPPFTMIGATTEIGKIAKPFTQRTIQIRLQEYSDEVLGVIVTKAFFKLGMKISSENGLYIAQRCRNNPRIANSTVKRIADKALVRYAAMRNLQAGSLDTPQAVLKLGIVVDEKVIDEYFEENGIDEYGLESGDRTLLKMIIERYNGGPVGIDTLARAMNEANNVIAQKYEAYLIKKGMLKIERDGRVAMPMAYKALGLPTPKHLLKEQDAVIVGDKVQNEVDSKYDTRKIVACKFPDAVKCDKLDALITYSGEARTFEEPLDDVFPDLIKDYETDNKHLCKLVIDFDSFNRELICDSFLESRFATSMALVGYIKDIKAQTLELPYVSQELADHRYFPDFIIKDYRNRIAIIEMKNYEMVAYHINIDKYEMLKSYCEQRGYGYAEIVKAHNSDKYMSTEMIKNMPVNTELEQFILDKIEQNGAAAGEGCFTQKDFDEYVSQHKNVDRTQLYTILLNNRRMKNVDRVGNNIKIILNG